MTAHDRIFEVLISYARSRQVPGWALDYLAGNEVGDVEVDEPSPSAIRLRREDETVEIRLQVVAPRPQATLVGPWRPARLRRLRSLDDLAYVVVDEVVDDVARVCVSAWPQVDERGRLHFADSRPHTVGVPVMALEEAVAAGGDRAPGRQPGIRAGTVLAANVDVRKLARGQAPKGWLRPPVRDVTEDARSKAQEAFSAAVTRAYPETARP